MVNGSSYQQPRRGRGKTQEQNMPPNTGAFVEIIFFVCWFIAIG
jgi:hypothetical protein